MRYLRQCIGQQRRLFAKEHRGMSMAKGMEHEKRYKEDLMRKRGTESAWSDGAPELDLSPKEPRGNSKVPSVQKPRNKPSLNVQKRQKKFEQGAKARRPSKAR